MRPWAATIIVVLTLWLEVAGLAPLRPFGVVPNLVLVVMLMLAIKLPPSTSIPLAVVAGLFLDLSSGSDFGLRTGFYVLLVVMVNLLIRQGTDLTYLSLTAGIVVLATLILNGAVLADLALGGTVIHWGYAAGRVAIELACNVVLLLPVRAIIDRGRRPAGESLVTMGAGRG